jgi:hypothetical protein
MLLGNLAQVVSLQTAAPSTGRLHGLVVIKFMDQMKNCLGLKINESLERRPFGRHREMTS